MSRWPVSWKKNGQSDQTTGLEEIQIRPSVEQWRAEMKEGMKILIAYDGSECANAALEDLKRAGLPQKVEAHVLSIHEEWIPAPASYGMVETDFVQDRSGEKDTLAMARRARAALQLSYPEWELHAEANIGSPATVILQRADELKPDLIVVGSHGRSAFSRFFLGSVSMKVVQAAHCTIRVARGHVEEPSAPIRLIVGVDGSKGAAAAVRTVAGRNWAKGSEVRVVHGTPPYPPVTADYIAAEVADWITAEKARVEKVIEGAVAELKQAGLNVSTVMKDEDPKYLLIDEAEAWGADSIFVGARGMGTLERFILGSVSSAIAVRAHCSVEVVRE
jgi:nucleotide-binding universal stress UspA family protein